jgi:hypothetical protein
MQELKPSPNEPYRIEVPAAAFRRPLRRTVDLIMPSGRRGEFYIRGAICWPKGGHPDQYGAFLVGAQDVQTQVVYVVAEGRFLTVDPCADVLGGVTFAGVANRLNDLWAKFYCNQWYYREEEGEHRSWMLQVLRSTMVQPKPQLIRIDWDFDTEAMIDRLVATGRVVMSNEGESFRGLTALRSRPGADGMDFPAVRALGALLAGVERHPWKWSHVTELDG